MIKDYKVEQLKLGDLIMCRDKNMLILSRVTTFKSPTAMFEPDNRQVLATDIKVFSTDTPSNGDGSRLINGYDITYYGDIKEEEFYELHPEYNI